MWIIATDRLQCRLSVWISRMCVGRQASLDLTRLERYAGQNGVVAKKIRCAVEV